MMVVRLGLAVLVLLGLAFTGEARASELRQAIDRPDVTEIGNPILISREVLDRELARNTAMAGFIAKYGWPDYAEVQEVAIVEPLAPYEVRLYYLRRNEQYAYTRAYVSPALRDFGVRTYRGSIPEETLARILTAKGEIAAPTEPVAEEVVRKDIAAAPPAVDEVEALVLRLEAAADRASLAAEMADRASKAASASADRANATLDKMLVP